MARDSQDTKRRIFEAATAEFTAHGIAGARVDRIAAAAGANKQLLYAYFGNKRKLFEAVVADHVERFMETVPFDATDLPCWAGDVFDFFVAHPEVWQLGAWHHSSRASRSTASRSSKVQSPSGRERSAGRRRPAWWDGYRSRPSCSRSSTRSRERGPSRRRNEIRAAGWTHGR